MFRNESGKLCWSWSRLILNSVPNFANDSKNDADLTPKQQDDLFRFQLIQPDPRLLSDQAFYVAGIVGAAPLSSTLRRSLLKARILTLEPPFLNTALITRHFPNQVPTISIHAQRKLVGLLFFWEEELMRWRLLEDEEAEIRSLLQSLGEGKGKEEDKAGGPEEEELRVALGKVQARRLMGPGVRGEEGSGGLPGYEERRGTVGVLGEGH